MPRMAFQFNGSFSHQGRLTILSFSTSYDYAFPTKRTIYVYHCQLSFDDVLCVVDLGAGDL